MNNPFRTIIMMAITAVISVSCEKHQVSVPETLITIDFVSSEDGTKSDINNETLINDVKLFVTRVSSLNGAREEYGMYYTDTGSVDVSLEDLHNEEYWYEFRAYANFGDIHEEPEVVEFDGYFDNGMKMHGETSLHAAGSDTHLSMTLSRYIGKVTVNSIRLEWNGEYLEDFTLDAMYVANAGKDNSILAESYYNINGELVDNEMQEYLYEDLGGVLLETGETYSKQHHFYGYFGFTSVEGTSIIIETSYDGRKMYYDIPADFSENYHIVLDFIIMGLGDDVPFGNKVGIDVSPVQARVRMFSVADWTVVSEKHYSEDTGYVYVDVDVDTGWDEGEDADL